MLDKLRSEVQGLSDAERSALAGIVETWAHLVELAAARSTSVSDIRRILGVHSHRGQPSRPEQATRATPSVEEDESSDAQSDAPTPDSTPPTKNEAKNRHPHGRRGPGAFGKLLEAHHTHTTMSIGDRCPQCDRGRIYKYRPDEFTTISGQSPLVATRHIVDALQCNLCKSVFKAPLPEILEEDGIYQRKLYSYSAVAIVATYRFFAGVPMHRQERLQRALGVAIPDASIWDMCERLAEVLRPIWRLLHRIATEAILFFGDDTGATILDERAKVRKNRKTGANEIRTGCHTTCIIAVAGDDHAISLFVTGIHHTGEVMDLVLAARDASLAPPIFMGDCIASNTVTKTAVLYAGCNSHAVRRFKALAERYPEEASYVLERYKKIYDNDEHCRDQGLIGEARRDYHREHSRPLLREICEYGADLFEQRRVEPNSDLGAALNYVIDNERRLSAFARHPFAPLDNNRCERELRICVQLRDTARFFKNAIGAGVADVVLTTGATALAAGVNLPEYFTAAQRHADDVRKHPELWLPWRYQDREQALREQRLAVRRGQSPPEFDTHPA